MKAKQCTNFVFVPKMRSFCGPNSDLFDRYSKKVILLQQAQQIVGSPALSGVNGVPVGIGGMLLFM